MLDEGNVRSFVLAIATTRARSASFMLTRTPTISGQANGYLLVASGPMASAYVSAPFGIQGMAAAVVYEVLPSAGTDSAPWRI